MMLMPMIAICVKEKADYGFLYQVGQELYGKD
jgi:hypothetical protein